MTVLKLATCIFFQFHTNYLVNLKQLACFVLNDSIIFFNLLNAKFNVKLLVFTCYTKMLTLRSDKNNSFIKL